jgi:hypothetical protein
VGRSLAAFNEHQIHGKLDFGLRRLRNRLWNYLLVVNPCGNINRTFPDNREALLRASIRRVES